MRCQLRSCDHKTDGTFELPEEECPLDKGVIRLVLRRSPPRRMRLRRASEGTAHLVHLPPVAEEGRPEVSKR